MNKIVLFLLLSASSSYAANYSLSGNSITNGAQDNTYIIGGSNSVSSNSSTQDGWLMIDGISNTLSNTRFSGVLGHSNYLYNSTHGFIVGNNNTVGTTATNSSVAMLGHSNTIQGTTSGWVTGSFNTISSTTNGVTLGQGNQISGATSVVEMGLNNTISSSGWSWILGSGNNSITTTNSSVVGVNNYINNINNAVVLATNGSFQNINGGAVIGADNTVWGYAGVNSGGYYAMGNSLSVKPSEYFRSLVILGVLNKEIPLSGDSANDNGPLFILGNGNGTAGTRSNAIVTQKSGRTTITNRNYITPTTQNPAPAQPETLVVEGSTTLKGAVSLAQRQGDIWMGNFGRSEDTGPSN